MIDDDDDDIANEQTMSTMDFISNEGLVNDFFHSLSISEMAVAHTNALNISYTAASYDIHIINRR